MVLTHYLTKIGAFLLIGAGIAAGFLGSNPLLKLKHANNPPASGKRRVVCVIGGGFGGLYSALYISLRCWSSADVYLIDPKKHFTMTPLLYELAVGTAQELEVTPCYKDLLTASNLKHMCGTVVSVDIPQQQCTILLTHSNDESTQQVVRFDELVIAAGIQPRIAFVQGAKEHALPFYSANDAFALKRKLKQLKTEVIGDINIVVIGGGYGGVEVAANIAENLCGYKSNVTIVDRNAQLMAASSDFNRNTAVRVLQRRGVSLRYNTSVNRVTSTSVELTDRNTSETFTLPAHLVILTAGTEQTSFVRGLDLLKDPQGKILTRRTLQSLQHEHIYALGDCAVVQGDHNPATAQVALQQAMTVASNVVESLRFSAQQESCATPRSAASTSTKPKLQEFAFFSLGEMVSLGDTQASMTSLGGWVNISGPLAAIGRRAVYAMRMPTLRQTWVALVSAMTSTANKLLGGGAGCEL